MLRELCRTHFRKCRPTVSRHVARAYSTQRIHGTNASASKTGRGLIAGATLIVTGAAGFWWLSAAQDPVPHLAETTAPERINVSPLSEQDVTALLSREAYSFKPDDKSGVQRYDGTRIAANSPCEDRFVHGQISSPNQDKRPWSAWGVFDGHSGWQTAELISKQLVPFVRNRLVEGKFPSSDHPAIVRAITRAFVDLDTAITSTALEMAHRQVPLHEKLQSFAPAYAGSCALFALFNPSSRTVYVACTGDSRAVLGRKSASGKWEAIPLSIDQDGSNPDEASRLHKEHPGEDDLVKDGRVLGLMVSRAFGDVQWKFPRATLSEFRKLYKTPGPWTPTYPVLTPPYLTAEPVVTTTVLPETPSFLILASDGLWFSITNQEAVDVIGYWLDHGVAPEKSSSIHGGFNFNSPDVPWAYNEECLTVEDSNAAVHLARNALGGRNRELVAARLAFWPPRKIRDDLTIQVVFFKPS